LKTVFLRKEMPSKTFSLVALLALGVVFLVITSGSNVYADGFADKRVRFDGKLTKGQLDENKNMGFSGRAKWDAIVAVRFSPIVRAQFSLAPFIETEAGGILGSYTITFTFAPKSRRVSYQNLRVKILDREGVEIASSGMVSRSGSGWVIGIATEQEPFDIHISYSSEKGSILTPADSEEVDDL
jgi:hypothetical protein